MSICVLIKGGTQPKLIPLDDLLAITFNGLLVEFREKLLPQFFGLRKCHPLAIMTSRESKHLRFLHPIIAILVDIPEEIIEAAPMHVV